MKVGRRLSVGAFWLWSGRSWWINGWVSMIRIERPGPFVTVAPDDGSSVSCEKAVLFDAFVYSSARVLTGEVLVCFKAEVCQH